MVDTAVVVYTGTRRLVVIRNDQPSETGRACEMKHHGAGRGYSETATEETICTVKISYNILFLVLFISYMD